MHEVLIKRTVYTAHCEDCGEKDVRSENAPREILCRCGKWIKFKEESYIGPEIKH